MYVIDGTLGTVFFDALCRVLALVDLIVLLAIGESFHMFQI